MVQIIERRQNADIAILPFWKGSKEAECACSDREFSSLIAPALETNDFVGKEGEFLFLYPPKKRREKRLLLLGLGPQKEATQESMRLSFAKAMQAIIKRRCKILSVFLPEEPDFDWAIAEGLLLANYSFDAFKEKPTPLVAKIALLGAKRDISALAKELLPIIEGVHLARDLVNGNADDVTPQFLVETGQKISKKFPSIQFTSLTKKQIVQEGMGLLLAVNRASSLDPAFMILEYPGAPQSKEKIAIVGKGITYDTGGLNLKPTGSMETMKCDMSGAAAVLGTLQAAAALRLEVNLIGIVASTENSIGPTSYKPGDVYRSHAGKTVEIGNTDAEGRLILADALSYVQKKLKPTQIIDLATLTGAITIALGEDISGLFCNNDILAEALSRAGIETFERVWRMPLCCEYRELLRSSIADINNTGGKKAGSITAALFLKEFIDGSKVSWAHLDIAGTAHPSELKAYHPAAHGTGVGVRLLISFLKQHQASS